MQEEVLRHRKIQKPSKPADLEEQTLLERCYENDSLPHYTGYVILAVFLILLRFFYVYENILPDSLTIKDVNSKPGRFIAERAQLHLKRLTELGTRVVGSYENEILAVDLLKREVSFIAQGAEKIHKIETDVQKPSGFYYLHFRPYGFVNGYANIQNIVVKLSSANATNSILLNCHFDTVPESPGASDNGLNCAVLLEILKVLSSSKKAFKNNVIFLFNGAEENPLQASHGFATQHKWREEVKVVINLDSAGAGGKEILFQTSGDPWLIKAYGNAVPRPNGAVQAEELFQYGIIPSDTDFRIFRDYGKYSGLDLAHCFNGYIYHTKNDKMEYIKKGVYQFTGDNILALTEELIQSPELGKTHEKTNLVYFDVFQLFFVSYTETVSIILNFTTVCLSLWKIIQTVKSLPDLSPSFCISLFFGTVGQVLGLVLAGAVVFIISQILDITKATMSWYLKSWLIIPLYVFPIIIVMVAVLLLTQTFLKKYLRGYKVVLFINGGQLLWTIILLIGTIKRIRSSFIIMLILLSVSVGGLLITLAKRKISVKSYISTHLAFLFFPLLYVLYQSIKIMVVIIPMAARMGPDINPEIIIGALTWILTTTFCVYVVPVLLLLKKLKAFMATLCVIHFLTMFGIICTGYGFPYDGNVKPPVLQRLYVFHCERIFYDFKGSIRRFDSGYFVQSLDRNNLNYLMDFIPELKNVPTAVDCKSELFCGFPIFTSRFVRHAKFSSWIPAAPPTIHQPTSLKVDNQTQISPNIRRLRFSISGPDHITILLSPKPNIRLLKWSLDEFEPQENKQWNNRSTFMVYYSHGLMEEILQFDVDFKVNQGHMESILDIAVVGHYMHDKKYRTENFKKFLLRFPDWTHLTPWTTTFKSWEI